MVACFCNLISLGLDIINGQKFSPREIDIIACIIGGRSSKFIANLLTLSPKTVETHIRNIKIKLNCFSKSQIVDFIEKSDKYQLTIQRYRELILEAEFEKFLYSLSSEVSKKNIKLKINCLLENREKQGINCCRLVKHLSLCGIKVFLECNCIDNLQFCENKQIIICSARTVLQIYNKYKNQTNNIIFFTDEPIEKNIKNISCISSDNNYYIAVKTLISNFIDITKVTKEKFLFQNSDYIVSDNIPSLKDKSKSVKSFWNKKRALILSFSLLITGNILFYFSDNLGLRKEEKITLYKQFINKDILLPRKEIINRIDEAFSKQNGIKFAILIGEGGIGKTVLARHYLQLKDFNVKAEIESENLNGVIESFKNLAIMLADTEELQKKLSYIGAIRDQEPGIKQMISFVFSLLKKKGNWCLFFDNVDNFNMIRNFIPLSDYKNEGKIIIATRNGNFKNIAAFAKAAIVDIPLLTVCERKDLFSKIVCEGKNDNKGQINLEKFLHYIPLMPLDVCAAAYYIKNTNISLDEYLKITRNPNVNSEKLYSAFLSEGINYNKGRYSILSSIFEEIIKANEAFKELLLVIFLLDSHNIPIDYLKQYKSTEVVQEFIHELRRFSLIMEKGEFFSIHRTTQELGLKYLINTLDNSEKEKFINNVVKSIAPYHKLISAWRIGDTTNFSNYYPNISRHLEAVLEKINICRISNEQLEKYKIQIMLTMLSDYRIILSTSQMKELVDNTIELNKKYKIIKNYDLAFLLLKAVYLYTNLEEIERIKEYMDKCLKICSITKNSESIKAACLCYLARYYSRNFKIKKALDLLRSSESLIDNFSSNADAPLVLVANQYYRCISNYFINKTQTYKAIDFLLSTLKKVKFSDLFYMIPRLDKSNVLKNQRINYIDLIELKMNLVRGYNRIGKFEEAYKYMKEVEFLYGLIEQDKDKFPDQKAKLELEKGKIFLRLNKVKEGCEVFSKLLSISSVYPFRLCFFALIYRSECYIRLGCFEDAYKDCEAARKINLGDNRGGNFGQLTMGICLYNMAIVKYRMNDIPLSKKHFNEFFEQMHKFCKNFFDKETVSRLEQQGVFRQDNNEMTISDYLKNSMTIFEKIYGFEHSFIKDYVSKIQ